MQLNTMSSSHTFLEHLINVSTKTATRRIVVLLKDVVIEESSWQRRKKMNNSISVSVVNCVYAYTGRHCGPVPNASLGLAVIG